MPEALVIVSAKPSEVTVPLGTDKRKAASVRTPFQQLANWLQWLDDRVANMLTGALAFTSMHAANATVDVKISAGQVEAVTGKFSGLLEALAGFAVTGTSTYSGLATFSAGANMGNDLYMSGTGQARVSFDMVELTQGNATISRNTYTKINSSGTSDFTLTIFGVAQRKGDWVQVYYIGTGNCTIKDPDGVTTVAALNGTTGIVVRLALNGSNQWRVVG